MTDNKTLERIELMHPKLREETKSIYAEVCSVLTGKSFCRFSYTLRTFAEQDKLYAQGRTEKGAKITNAKGGLSYHNYGLALDIVIIDGKSVSYDVKKDFDKDGKADWIEIVSIFKQYGWEWGGDWKFYDAPHFQKTYGHSIRELLDLYNKGKVDKNNYVLI
jgi:peptidoglycan L-alanyl-D-glutamate endopeptidase CwlK